MARSNIPTPPGVYMGRKVVYQDTSTSVKTSPLAVTTAIVEIIPPDGAVMFFGKFDGDDGKIGGDSDFSEGYILCADGEWSLPVPCHSGKSIYVSADDGSGNLSFYFEID